MSSNNRDSNSGASALLHATDEGMGSHRRKFRGGMRALVTGLAAAMSLYQLLYISRILESAGIFISKVPYLASSLGFILVLVFLNYPMTKKSARDRLPWYDIIFILLSIAGCAYVSYLWSSDSVSQFAYAGTEAIILGSILILLVLEATRRVTDWAMTLTVLAFIFYAKFSNFFPWLLEGRGYNLERIVGHLYLTGEGIFSTPLDISVSVVVAYIIFAQFLHSSGAGKFFIDLAFSAVGHYRGGPAKVAVIASSLFGMLSGSAVGNVASVGIFTIPMMKKVGYQPHFAAAVEAVSSNGGQLMPPVMGAVAFIMAEFLGVSYWTIALAAAVPSLLYYLSIFLMVHIEAVKAGFKTIPRAELPSFRKTLAGGWWYFAPLVILILLLGVFHYSPEMAAILSLISLFLLSLIRKETRMGPAKIVRALADGGHNTLMVGVTCAASGILLGVVSLTGLGLNLSAMLVDLAHGSLAALLVLTAIASFVLGLGLNVTACYILLAILIAPALINMGANPIAAHMFVLYWGLVSMITPPVALTAFAAAAIADSSPMRTGWEATRLGLVSYIVPFMFVYGPALLLIGTAPEIVLALVTSILGCVALAGAVEGYLLAPAGIFQRILMMAAALLLIIPGWQTDIVGAALLAPILLWQRKSSRKAGTVLKGAT